MKKYIKPSIEVLAVEAMDQILADSSIDLDLNDNTGYDPNIGELSLRRKVYIEDDWEDDEPDYGW